MGDGEADQVRAFLEAHGIPCALRGESQRNFGLTQHGIPQVRICVPPERADQARELLKQVQAGHFALPDDPDEVDPQRD